MCVLELVVGEAEDMIERTVKRVWATDSRVIKGNKRVGSGAGQ